MTHVLVVEDDPALRRSLTLNLTARGYTVDDTGNGEDALRLAGRRLPDVLFVDLGLPGMSGLDVIRGVRAWADIPIIVLSARGAEHDKVEALDAGATDYVTKPFGIEELMARLRAAERIRAVQRPDDGPTVTPDFTIDYTAHRVHRTNGERDPPHADRVRDPGAPRADPRSLGDPHRSAARRLGTGVRQRDQLLPRAHHAPAQEDRTRPVEPDLRHHRARSRLPVQRDRRLRPARCSHARRGGSAARRGSATSSSPDALASISCVSISTAVRPLPATS